MKAISTDQAPQPAGHYAQGIKHNCLVYVSGQLAVRPDGSHSTDVGFDAQARQALENALSIVKAGGGDVSGVLKVTAYIVGIDNWPAFNSVFADVFNDHRPARAIVPVPELHFGYQVEVEMVAALEP
jgi:reactive intermediate/imine deaminase